MNYSIAEENYIKAVYHLQQSASTVSTNGLAAQMQTKPASITDMLKKLKAKGLLDYEPYKGVALTDSGLAVALTVIRRHRLWEFFLVKHLGFGWNQVHEVAEQLEHVQSTLLTQRLDDFLGKPAFDPHGDPIPDERGRMAQRHRLPLADLAPNVPATICAVANQTNALLEMLTAKKLELGTPVEVIHRFDFDNSMEINILNTEKVMLSQQLASHLFVQIIA
jgi:DtxR family Mn-dependent transcriptional regulator